MLGIYGSDWKTDPRPCVVSVTFEKEPERVRKRSVTWVDKYTNYAATRKMEESYGLYVAFHLVIGQLASNDAIKLRRGRTPCI